MNILKLLFDPTGVIGTLLSILIPKKDDWVMIDIVDAVWEITNQEVWGGPAHKPCWYEIQFSPSRNKYRMKEGGYQPGMHKAKLDALKKLSKLNKELIEHGRPNHTPSGESRSNASRTDDGRPSQGDTGSSNSSPKSKPKSKPRRGPLI